jgi:hypothetical protein
LFKSSDVSPSPKKSGGPRRESQVAGNQWVRSQFSKSMVAAAVARLIRDEK